MQRVIDRVRNKTSGVYKEAGAARKRARQEKLSPLELLNEIEVVTMKDAEYSQMDLENKVDHVAKNMGT